MAEEEKKKSIFDKLIDAVTDRDEKEAAEKAADKAAADKAAAERAAAQKVTADKAAAAKAAADKEADEKVAAARVAASNAASERAIAGRAAAEKVAAERAAERATAQAAAASKKGVVQVRSLYIRAEHSANAKSVGGLVKDDEVTIHETWTDGKDTWARIGDDQWSAMIYNGETYIKVQE